MPIIKKFAPFQNLSTYNTLFSGGTTLSEYLRITDFPDTFTGGKNAFLIEGSEHLQNGTEVKLEILDVNGNPIYFEPGNGIPEYYEGISKVVSVHVYDDTPIGISKVTILAELKTYIDQNGQTTEVPERWKGTYNYKWERQVQVNKNLANETKVRFYRRPKIEIEEIVKPVFTKRFPTVTQSGTVSGFGETPSAGTDLTNYLAGTLYRLQRETGPKFTQSIDEDIIEIPSLNYTATVSEVLNEDEVLVEVPYTENNIVTNFSSQAYTSSFTYTESADIFESAITGSFAKVKINDLKTFAGDVARVKILRRSRNKLGDYEIIQDTKLESTELLRDINTQVDTEIPYGNLTQDNVRDYWVTSSVDHPIRTDSSILYSALTVDYDSGQGGVQQLITSASVDISNNVEYTLKYKARLSGSLNSDKSVRAFLSSSEFTQDFFTLSGSAILNTKQDISENIISNYSGSAKLVFEFQGDGWYVSNISLRNAQDTSFSPDEITLIQPVTRTLPTETFDYIFEFYDINNNFIPVEVTATKEFDGGNDTEAGRLQKFLTFESDRTAFRFVTGSIGNPEFQQIGFKVTRNLLTGSVAYISQAFDTDGNLLTDGDYSGGQYPGLLTNPSDAGATLTIGNFTGSRSDITVGSITYTASLENFEEYETIYRLQDGDNAPGLFTTANTNQFIYEPTTIRDKPSGQEIRIQAQRKNLGSLISVIEVNSGSGAPPLTDVSDTNGIKKYSLSAQTFSASYGGMTGAFPEVTYEFTSSDQFNNEFTDEITISPVINFDGISVVLSNESTTFSADSTGLVTANGYDEGDGSVTVNIGDQTISHNDGLNTRNTFDIVSVSGTNVTPNSTSPNTNSYGISDMSSDSGSLDLVIDYLAGDNATSASFVKKVNYTKARKSAPVISVQTTNKDQTVTANSKGVQLGEFQDSVITVSETYLGSTTSKTITSLTAIRQDTLGSIPTTPSTGIISLSSASLADNIPNTTVAVTAEVVDSEGTTRSVVDTLSLSKVRNAPPTIVISASPQSQTVTADSSGTQVGTLGDVVVSAIEGTGSVFDSMTINSTTGFSVNPTVNSNVLEMGSATMNANEAFVDLSVTYTDSESTTESRIITINSSLSIEGEAGVSGSDGVTGPGIVGRGFYTNALDYQFSTTFPGRRDAVIYQDRYFATLQPVPSGSGNAPPTTSTDNAYWEFLGTEELFVAAKIIISENSFVEEVLNVGTNIAGDTANITIDGSGISPYIALGQSPVGVYGDSGIFIGTEFGSAKMSLSGSFGSLLWDGSSLNIEGNITITGGSGISNFSDAGGLATGSIGDLGAFAAIDQINSGNSTTYIGAGSIVTSQLTTNIIQSTNYSAGAGYSSAGTYLNLLDGAFYSENFYIDTNGDAFFRGELNAATGSFTGTLSAAEGTFAGRVTAGTMELGTGVNSGANNGIYINSNNYWYDTGDFKVGGVGNSVQWDNSTLTVTGDITVTNTEDYVFPNETGSLENPTDYAFGGNDFLLRNTSPSGSGLHLGSNRLGYYDNGTWKTYMDNSGNFYLTGSGTNGLSWNSSTNTLSVNGTILADDGNIGGWSINSASLASGNGNITLNSTSDGLISIGGTRVRVSGNSADDPASVSISSVGSSVLTVGLDNNTSTGTSATSAVNTGTDKSVKVTFTTSANVSGNPEYLFSVALEGATSGTGPWTVIDTSVDAIGDLTFYAYSVTYSHFRLVLEGSLGQAELTDTVDVFASSINWEWVEKSIIIKPTGIFERGLDGIQEFGYTPSGQVASSPSVQVNNSTITLAEGSNISITETDKEFSLNQGSDQTLTINATNTNTTYTAGTGLYLSPTDEFSLDLPTLTESIQDSDVEFFAVIDNTINENQYKIRKSNINLSGFNNDLSITDVKLSTLDFNTGSGVLTATLSDTATVTENLDGRYSLTTHNHVAGDILTTGGTFADALIAETNVTQHEAALDIDWNTQVFNKPAFDAYNNWVSDNFVVGSGQHLEFVGGTNISVTDNSGAGDGSLGNPYQYTINFTGTFTDRYLSDVQWTDEVGGIPTYSNKYMRFVVANGTDIDFDVYGNLKPLFDLLYDNYSFWKLHTNDTFRENIDSTEIVNIKQGGSTTVAYSATNNTITISSTDTNTTYTAGLGINLDGSDEFTVSAGTGLTQTTTGLELDGSSIAGQGLDWNTTTAGALAVNGVPNSALVNDSINFVQGTGITLSASTAELGGTALTISANLSDFVNTTGDTMTGGLTIDPDSNTFEPLRVYRGSGINKRGIELTAQDVNNGSIGIIRHILDTGGTGAQMDFDSTAINVSTGILSVGNNLVWDASDFTSTQITQWDTAYDERGSVIAGTNLTWNGTQLDATDTNTTYTAGNGIGLSGTTFSVSAGTGLTQTTTGLSNADRGSSQNIFKNIANAAGTTQFSAGSNSDSLRFAQGGSTTVSFDGTSNRIIISSTDTNTTYTAGTALDLSGTTFNVDLSELNTSTTNGDGDYFVVVDTGNNQRKLTKGNINLTGFNNDLDVVGTTNSPVDNDYAKFTNSSTVEGMSYSQVRSDLTLATNDTVEFGALGLNNSSNPSQGTTTSDFPFRVGTSNGDWRIRGDGTTTITGNLFIDGDSQADDHVGPSDIRIKTILKHNVSAIEISKYVNLHLFDKRGKEQYGIIAQDLMRYDKRLVGTTPDEEFGEIYTVSPYSISSIALTGVKELDSEIGELKKEIKRLNKLLEKNGITE